jgi:hypothetical protein
MQTAFLACHDVSGNEYFGKYFDTWMEKSPDQYGSSEREIETAYHAFCGCELEVGRCL